MSSRPVPLTVITPDVASRTQCGPCRACCTVMGVQELGKPYSTPCEHECDKGCAIYGNHPDSCQGFYCLWRAELLGLDESMRPDKFPYMLSGGTSDLENLGITLDVYEVRTPRFKDVRTMLKLVHRLLEGSAGQVRFVRYYPLGHVVGCDYDVKPPYPEVAGSRGGNKMAVVKGHEHFLIHIPQAVDSKARWDEVQRVVFMLFGHSYEPGKLNGVEDVFEEAV